MEEYNYNYQQIQIPNNYPIYENSINEIQSKYINYTNIPLNDYQNYEIKSFPQNSNESNYNNIYNIQTTNITNISYPLENYYINNENNINKIPKDTNYNTDKVPLDNLKGKQKLDFKNSLKRYSNYNKRNKINILENENVVTINLDKEEKQPTDNYGKHSHNNKLIKGNKKNPNNKINNNRDNTKERNVNSNKNNNLKTKENNMSGCDPKKSSKKNSIKTMERIKKNNLISINDVLTNKKDRISSKTKDVNKKNINNSKNKILKKKLDYNLTKNLSTNKRKEKSNSNFASLINQKKIKMFSSFKLVNNTNPINSNDANKKTPKNNKIISIKNNKGRLYSPQLTSPLQKKIADGQIEIAKTKEIFSKKNRKENIYIETETKGNISSNKDKNFTINKKLSNNQNNSNKGNRASSFRAITEKYSNFSSKKRKNVNSSFKGALNKKENEDNFDIMDNFIQKAYNKKTMNTNRFNSKKKNKDQKIIRKQLSFWDSKKGKFEEKNNIYETSTNRKFKKNIIYSRRDEDNVGKTEVNINPKKNLYTFMKKTHRKNSNNSSHKLSEERIDMHNISYKGFSSIKKLEQIKKKYKFYPHNKDSNSLLKDRYIDFNQESKEFIKLVDTMDLNNSKEVKNLNLTEFLPQNEINFSETNEEHNNEGNIKIMENEEYKEEVKEEEKEEEENNNKEDENDNDVLNHKSFILDLNNVIPINEKQLRDTFNTEKLAVLNKKI